MKTYYHATKQENLPGIIISGLISPVYVCESPIDCLKFLALRGETEIFVLKLQIPDDLIERNLEESFDHSEEFFKCKVFVYTEILPRKYIKSVTKYEL